MTLSPDEIMKMKLEGYETGRLDALIACGMPLDTISELLNIPIDRVKSRYNEIMEFKLWYRGKI